MTRTRVLWVAKGLGAGGMEHLLAHHARFGDHERFDYRCAFMLTYKDQLVEPLEAAGVECTDLGVTNDLDLRWMARLRSLMHTWRPEIVHTHSPAVAPAVRLMTRTVRPRPLLVYTEHNSWGVYRADTRWANRVTYRFDDEQLAVSDAAFDSVPTDHRRHLRVLTHGIDLDAVTAHRAERPAVRAELGVDDGELVVGTVANFRPEKNYPLLLEVAADVTRRRRDVTFVSIGQGPLLDAMTTRRDELGLGDRFRILGHRPDAARTMAGFDVFVLTSTHEGLPVALMEARAIGLPVVATAVGGVRTAVRDGLDGCLLPSGDAAGLADAIVALDDDRDRLAAMAAASRDVAGAYDARRAVQQIEATYLSGLSLVR